MMKVTIESIDARVCELINQAKTEFAKSCIKNIQTACKKLLEVNSPITVTAVGKYIDDVDHQTFLDGSAGRIGPKSQSIRNNKDYKGLVNLYSVFFSQSIKPKPSVSKKLDKPDYPSDGLDQKTRHYIDMLHAQVKSNENTIKTLKQSIKQDEGILLVNDAIKKTNNSNKIEHITKVEESLKDQVIKRILQLSNNHPEAFELKERNNKVALYTASKTNPIKILSAKEWRVLSDEYFGNLQE